MPPDPLGGLWAYAHSIIVVTVHNQRSESPTLFYYLFSALDDACSTFMQLCILNGDESTLL